MGSGSSVLLLRDVKACPKCNRGFRCDTCRRSFEIRVDDIGFRVYWKGGFLCFEVVAYFFGTYWCVLYHEQLFRPNGCWGSV